MKIITKLSLICLILFAFITDSNAQFKRYGGKKKPQKMGDFIRPLNNTGWYFAPGATFTPKFNFFKYEPTLTTSTFQPDVYTALNLKQQSQTGFYFEAGRYHLLSTKKILSYIDYGLAYKMLRAKQTYDLEREGFSTTDTTSYVQTYRSQAAVAHFNANNVLAINKNIFFQNTLGVNVDYLFSRTLTTTDNSGFDETYQEEPGRLWAQLHYKFGVGFRIGEMWYMIPSVEIPILNGWQWEDGRSTFGAFNSRYRPVIFSLRFAWLTTPDCPKVWDNDSSIKNGGGL